MLKLMNSYVKSILHRWEKVTSPSGEVEIKVTHTHTKTGEKGLCGGGCWRRKVGFERGRAQHPPSAASPHLPLLTAPLRTLTVSASANCRCASLPS